VLVLALGLLLAFGLKLAYISRQHTYELLASMPKEGITGKGIRRSGSVGSMVAQIFFKVHARIE